MWPHLKCIETLDVPIDDFDMAAHKAELLMARAKHNKAGEYFERLLEELPPTNEEVVQKVYLRIARFGLRACIHERVLGFLDNVPEEFRGPTFEALWQVCKHHHQIDLNNHRSFFPVTVPIKQRDEGPHLFDDFDPDTITSWASGSVDWIDEDGFSVDLVEEPSIKLVSAYYHRVDEGFEREDVEMTVKPSDLYKWSEGDELEDNIWEGSYFEFVVVNGDKDNPIFRWHETGFYEWEGWNHIPPLQMDINRYIRHAGWVTGDSTFTESCIEGKEDPSNIAQYIQQWEDGDVMKHKRGWPLSDWLGLMPEELEEWQSGVLTIKQILDKR